VGGGVEGSVLVGVGYNGNGVERFEWGRRFLG